jgi:hypothetical protein
MEGARGEETRSISVRTEAPVAVGAVLWRDHDRRVIATVVAKVTYRLRPEVCDVAGVPDPIVEADTFSAVGPGAVLLAASDLAPFKRGADLVLVGRAYAPRDRPQERLLARVVVGGIVSSGTRRSRARRRRARFHSAMRSPREGRTRTIPSVFRGRWTSPGSGACPSSCRRMSR